ncbi:unnamed protein product, partial [Effrenium voratum]
GDGWRACGGMTSWPAAPSAVSRPLAMMRPAPAPWRQASQAHGMAGRTWRG